MSITIRGPLIIFSSSRTPDGSSKESIDDQLNAKILLAKERGLLKDCSTPSITAQSPERKVPDKNPPPKDPLPSAPPPQTEPQNHQEPPAHPGEPPRGAGGPPNDGELLNNNEEVVVPNPADDANLQAGDGNPNPADDAHLQEEAAAENMQDLHLSLLAPEPQQESQQPRMNQPTLRYTMMNQNGSNSPGQPAMENAYEHMGTDSLLNGRQTMTDARSICSAQTADRSMGSNFASSSTLYTGSKQTPLMQGNNNARSFPNASTLSGLTGASNFMAQGKWTTWNDIRNAFGQMLQLTAHLESQGLTLQNLSTDHFFIDAQGKMSLMNTGQAAANGAAQRASANPNTLSQNAIAAQRGNALGLILLEMCTGQIGQAPQNIDPATGQTDKQMIQNGNLQLPSHIPGDLREVITGLLQLKPPAHLDVAAALNMLHFDAAPTAPLVQQPQQLPPVHLKASPPLSQQTPSKHESSFANMTVPSTTLFMSSNSPTVNKEAASEEEEEEDEEGQSIRAIVFGSELVFPSPDCIDPEIKSFVDALKANKTKVNLLSKGDETCPEETNALFDRRLDSSKLGFNKLSWRAFDALLETLDLPADEILFIDTNPATVKAAKIMGLDAFVFTSLKQLNDELRKRKLLAD